MRMKRPMCSIKEAVVFKHTGKGKTTNNIWRNNKDNPGSVWLFVGLGGVWNITIELPKVSQILVTGNVDKQKLLIC